MACIKRRRGKWVVDYRDAAGKRKWETKPDKKSAQDRLAEILKSPNPVMTEERTVKEYGDWWLENVARGSIKESTYREYEAVLKKHVYPMLGACQFGKVTRVQIRELIAAKKAEGYEQSTIRNIMAPVRGMFFQAVEDGVSEKNPAARIGKLNRQSKDKPKKRINPLTREEIQVLLKTTLEKRPHFYPLLLCACRTGARMGELIALKGGDIDFNSRLVHVQRNLSRGKISATKNGKDRKVDMSQQLAAVLNELLSRRRAHALQEEFKKPAEARRDRDAVINEVMEDWLFQTPVGSRLDHSNLRKVFHRLLTDAKLRRVRFHDLRHSFASLLLGNGKTPTYVKEQMGHSSIQVTVDIYGHLVPGGNRAAVDELDDEPPAKNAAPNCYHSATGLNENQPKLQATGMDG